MPTLRLLAFLVTAQVACVASLVGASADASRIADPDAAAPAEGRVSGELRLRPLKTSKPKRPANERRHAAARRRAAAARRSCRPKTPNRVQPPAARTPNDPLWSGDWSLRRVNAPGAWTIGTGAASTVVAVVDTGVDASQPDLAGALVPGWDFVGDDADPNDEHGHGTAVAGVIAARSNNGIGVASACWSCSIMPVKVVGGDGVGTSEDIAAGIAWAADHGAHVINLSLVLTGDDPAVAQAVAHAQARGALVVAAAGNAGGAGLTYPGAYAGVLSVAGTDAGDAPYGWSTRGSWVTFAAPGCNLTTSRGGGFGEFCGSSSAAAAVSGIAGLARSLGGDAQAIANALRTGAASLGFVGAGRVDARATLERLAPRGR